MANRDLLPYDGQLSNTLYCIVICRSSKNRPHILPSHPESRRNSSGASEAISRGGGGGGGATAVSHWRLAAPPLRYA